MPTEHDCGRSIESFRHLLQSVTRRHGRVAFVCMSLPILFITEQAQGFDHVRSRFDLHSRATRASSPGT